MHPLIPAAPSLCPPLPTAHSRVPPSPQLRPRAPPLRAALAPCAPRGSALHRHRARPRTPLFSLVPLPGLAMPGPPNLSPPILSSPALCPLEPKSPPAPSSGLPPTPRAPPIPVPSAASALPLGLGRLQGQIPRGHGQGGPIHLENATALRPQQKHGLPGGARAEPAGHLRALQGVPDRVRRHSGCRYPLPGCCAIPVSHILWASPLRPLPFRSSSSAEL